MQDDERQNIVCRCEEITKDEIIDAIRKGDKDLGSIKRRTRAGMGLCQGKTCSKLISRLIADETGVSISDIKPSSMRQPVNPITLGAMASGEGEEVIKDLKDLKSNNLMD